MTKHDNEAMPLMYLGRNGSLERCGRWDWQVGRKREPEAIKLRL